MIKQFFVEDGLLLFAMASLCATTGLAITNMQDLYNSLAAILQGPNLEILLESLHRIPIITRRNNAASILWWCVIFPIKLAFLFFFRRLIIRLPRMYVWWWCGLAFTILSWAAATVADMLTCPWTNVEQVLCKQVLIILGSMLMDVLACSGSSGNMRVIRDTAITTAVDVITDFIVLSFPVILLWDVRVSLRQKLALSLSLCLSLVMILVAIVRIAGYKTTNGVVDVVWLAFWQQQECSIAVMVVSISAFRALFVARSMNRPARRPLRQSVNDWRRRIERRRLGPSTEENEFQPSGRLPQVPRPTLTGMSSVIRRA